MRLAVGIFFSLTFICSVSWLLWLEMERQQEEDVNGPHYHSFGVKLPRNTGLVGIDISRYQDRIDWEGVKNARDGEQCISFVFIKATEGGTHTDLNFKENWRAAKEAGLRRGAYHYFRPLTTSDKQFQNFTGMVHLQSGDLPPVVDFEEEGRNKDKTLSRLKDLLTKLERHYGVKPIVYCNYDYYRRYIEGTTLESYPIWLAHYGVANPRTNNWMFWQFSDRATISGIAGKVDLNVFQGDSTKLMQLCMRR